MATTYRTKDGDMLDVIWKKFYGHESRTVETVLKANPGLAELGPIYESGVVITLPELSDPVKKLVSLYE